MRLKLALLAGVPVLGAMILSALIAREASERAATAKAVGTIEDLVQLTERVARVVHELQAERSESTFRAGLGETKGAELAAREQRTDGALRSLEAFLSERDQAQLPPSLRENLSTARGKLRALPKLRQNVRARDFQLYEYLELHSEATSALIAATSVLSQLTQDGELMLSISRLVAAMQVTERISREHALLSYVFAKKEFPPGTFRFFVTLLTEQEVYKSALRASASADDYRRFEAIVAGPHAEKVTAMRKTALDASDGELELDAREWFNAQSGNVQALRRVENGMARAVRAAVTKKMVESRQAIRLGMGLAGGVLLVSTVLAWAIARSVTRSVGVLSDTAEVVQRNRDFSVRARKTSRDELGRLTDAFNAMLAGIQERDRELQEHRENLQALVEERTIELSKRNDDMRLVLDNVEEGLAIVDRNGKLREECSRAFAEAFGEPSETKPFHLLLAPNDARTATALALGYEQYIEGFLPPEVAIDQLPHTLHLGKRQYTLTARPLLSDGKPDGALLVMRDVTAEVAAQRADAIQREQIKSFQRMLQDRGGFSEFFREAQALVEFIRSRTNVHTTQAKVERMRAVHTLKGNAGQFEIRSVAEAAHAFESAVAENDAAAADGALRELLRAWDDYAAKIAPLLAEHRGQRVEVNKEDFERALESVRERVPHSELERLLVRWQLEPISVRFARVSEQLRALAVRQGKPEPEVVIRSGDVRMPIGPFSEFWSSFAHVVRNTVDHGVQTPDERLRAGKSARARIELTASSDAGTLVIEIKDDGPGIDWARLAARAAAMGLPSSTRADLISALTTDGVSTRARVTETSGRGVGFSAVLAACTRVNAKLVIDSEPGQGTRVRIIVPPVEKMAPSSAAG